MCPQKNALRGTPRRLTIPPLERLRVASELLEEPIHFLLQTEHAPIFGRRHHRFTYFNPEEVLTSAVTTQFDRAFTKDDKGAFRTVESVGGMTIGSGVLRSKRSAGRPGDRRGIHWAR